MSRVPPMTNEVFHSPHSSKTNNRAACLLIKIIITHELCECRAPEKNSPHLSMPFSNDATVALIVSAMIKTTKVYWLTTTLE